MSTHPVALGGGCHLKGKVRQIQARPLCVTVLVLSVTAQRLRTLGKYTEETDLNQSQRGVQLRL